MAQSVPGPWLLNIIFYLKLKFLEKLLWLQNDNLSKFSINVLYENKICILYFILRTKKKK